MLEKLAKVCKKFCCKSFCKLLQVFGAFILFYFILRVRVALCNNRQQAVNAVIIGRFLPLQLIITTTSSLYFQKYV